MQKDSIAVEKSETAVPSTAAGVVAVYIADGRVITHAADFERSRPAGFELKEAQQMRCRDELVRAVVRAYCSPVVADALDVSDCDRIVRKLDGKMHFICIGYEATS